MSSAEGLRHLISERLTAAAEEIFRAFQATIIKYEEEIDRQSRLLDLVLKPDVKLHRTELPQQLVCKEEEEGLADFSQLCNQERNSNLGQHEPDPPQIKEEQEELCCILGGEQLVVKQETETSMLFPNCEESDLSKDQSLDLSPDGTPTAAEKVQVVAALVKHSVKPEPNSCDQRLFHNSHVAEGQDHRGDPGSTRNADQHPQHIHCQSNNCDNKKNSTTLMIHSDTLMKECLKCDTCGKSFKHKSRLRSHLRVHTGEKPYPCNVCGKRFSMLGHLKGHMRVHTGEKPHPCNVCERRFSKMSSLKVHMRTHTGERPYPCNICEKRFSHLEAAKVHMRTHTGERPYPCSTCEKRFFKLSALKVHMRVHTGERPYLCSMCEKRFSHLETLKVHTRLHMDEKPYKCKICGKDFRQIQKYRVHMRTHSVGKDSLTCQT